MAEFHNWLRNILFFTGLLIKSWIKVLFSLTRAINMGASTCRETRGIYCNSSVIVFCFGTATLKFQVFVLTHYFGLKHCGLAFVSHFNVFAHSRAWITTCNSVNKILEFWAECTLLGFFAEKIIWIATRKTHFFVKFLFEWI